MRIWDNDKLPLRPGMTVHVVPGFGELGWCHLVLSDTRPSPRPAARPSQTLPETFSQPDGFQERAALRRDAGRRIE
jgi:hypothetical protein